MADWIGRRTSTDGAARAPRCLYRKPTFVARAQRSARTMPKKEFIARWRGERSVLA
jgi:hypothetical protein